MDFIFHRLKRLLNESIIGGKVWDVRHQIGMVFQNPDNQFVGATVQDDVAFALENNGVPSERNGESVVQALYKGKNGMIS